MGPTPFLEISYIPPFPRLGESAAMQHRRTLARRRRAESCTPRPDLLHFAQKGRGRECPPLIKPVTERASRYPPSTCPTQHGLKCSRRSSWAGPVPPTLRSSSVGRRTSRLLRSKVHRSPGPRLRWRHRRAAALTACGTGRQRVQRRHDHGGARVEVIRRHHPSAGADGTTRAGRTGVPICTVRLTVQSRSLDR